MYFGRAAARRQASLEQATRPTNGTACKSTFGRQSQSRVERDEHDNDNHGDQPNAQNSAPLWPSSCSLSWAPSGPKQQAHFGPPSELMDVKIKSQDKSYELQYELVNRFNLATSSSTATKIALSNPAARAAAASQKLVQTRMAADCNQGRRQESQSQSGLVDGHDQQPVRVEMAETWPVCATNTRQPAEKQNIKSCGLPITSSNLVDLPKLDSKLEREEQQIGPTSKPASPQEASQLSAPTGASSRYKTRDLSYVDDGVR